MKSGSRSIEAVFGDRLAPDGSLVRENFARWFANSKVVDQDMNPLEVYHGTDKTFSHFDLTKSGQKDTGWYGVGHYMTVDPDAASAYAGYEQLKSVTGDSPAPM